MAYEDQDIPAQVSLSIPDTPATAEKLSSQVQDVRGYGAFTEVFRHELPARARLGQITVAGSIIDTAGYDHSAIELLIIGYAASQRNVLRRGVLGGRQALIVHQTRDGESFSAIAVEARIMVDGVAGASGPTEASLAVQSRFFLR